ncbi:ependymin-2-like [Latimeria chalumnae]|uniref:Ependymin n=2 Tax=Latimeria chalumnae TaxID=7897 RepID=M3XKD4_LATCH|nr:PREDICTED: ependymin-2-like [Latimeria chalumnae]|eukprot:XP_005988944.1 PREDICTED: ependymin-2-like [Latimeria chalumnae]
MKALTALLTFGFLFLLTDGQKPKPCEGPLLLEGQFVVMDSSKKSVVMGKFSNDTILQRSRVVEEIFLEPNKTIKTEKILLYNMSTMYTINLETKSCNKTHLDTPFRKIEVPKDAEFVSQLVFGGSSDPREGLLVNIWKGTEHEFGGYYQVSVTEFGCLPLSTLYLSEKTSWVITSYLNLTEGIEDPNVFVPPSFCNT